MPAILADIAASLLRLLLLLCPSDIGLSAAATAALASSKPAQALSLVVPDCTASWYLNEVGHGRTAEFWATRLEHAECHRSQGVARLQAQAEALTQAHAQTGTLLAEALTTAVAAVEQSGHRLAVANAELLEQSTSMGVSSLVIGRWQNAIPGSGTAEEKQKRKSVMNAICKKRKAAAALVD